MLPSNSEASLAAWGGFMHIDSLEIRRFQALQPACREPAIGCDTLHCASVRASDMTTALRFLHVASTVLDGHHPRGTTLREALQGNLPLRRAFRLRGLCVGLFGGSAGVCGVLRWSKGFSEGSDPMILNLRNCLE